MINTLIFIVSTGFTYLSGFLSKKFKWNKKLPIEFQNYLIGLVVFFVAWLITDPENLTELWEQIWTALGGAGAATLIYDTKKKMKGE